MISQKNKQGWRNPWLLGLLAVVFAGVMSNMQMLWNVLHNPTRLLDEHYTVREHNQHDAKWLQQQVERSTLGWHAKLHSPQQLQNDPDADPSAIRFVLLASPSEMQFDLTDHDGKPVQGAKVVINAQWPGNPQFDFKADLFETSTPAHYVGSLKFPRPGNWDLLIQAEYDGRQFVMEQKVFAEIPAQP
jgi:nitrogen fixation protein FixH